MTVDDADKKPARLIGRPWQKGQSGNPAGYPKALADVVAHARAYTVAAVETLASNLHDEDARVRNAAAIALLERAWGKPVQPLAGGETAAEALHALANALTAPEG